MFIILAFTACLANQCQEFELTFSAEDLTLHQCQMGAQAPLAQWANQRPGWQVSKFECLEAKNRKIDTWAPFRGLFHVQKGHPYHDHHRPLRL